MTIPREQDVLGQMYMVGNDRAIPAVCELLTALGYEDVARELQRRWDDISDGDEDGVIF